MIYETGIVIIRAAVQQYFSRVSEKGAGKEEHSPLLIAANHPNCALDPILIATNYRRQIWFLAKSTIFKGKALSAFMRACHMIPVYRRQDSASGNVDNNKTFEAAAELLRARRALAIFPEGVSLGERKLQPLRTGIARIAFQAEEQAGFQLGLKIQPIGITYTDLRTFRSAVTLYFGEPINVQDYKALYERDADEAVRTLTDLVETRLREVTIEVREREHEELVDKIGKVFQSRDRATDDFQRLQLIAYNVEALTPGLSGRKQSLEKRIDAYLALLRVFRISAAPSGETVNNLQAMILTPFVAFGALSSWIPYRLVGSLTRRYSGHVAVDASYKFGLGLLLFPAWFLLLSGIVAVLSSSALCGFIAFVLLVTCAAITNNFMEHVRLFLLSKLWPGDHKPIDVIRTLGDDLINEMEALRVDSSREPLGVTQ